MKHRRLGHLATLALAFAVSASTAGTAFADTPSAGMSVTATVYAAGSSPLVDQTTVATLESGQNCPVYVGPSPEQHGAGAATAPEINPETAWDIGTLISQCLPTKLPLSSVTGVTIISADGSPQLDAGAQLSQADLEGQSSFPVGELPVVTDDGDGLIYERPWRGGSDDNAADVLTINAPDGFNLEVFTGPLLTVTATASSVSPHAGQRVTFSATSTGSSRTVTYSWNFGDGAAVASGASTTKSFATPGVYDIVVEATDSDGGGGYGSIQLQVGNPPPTTSTHTNTTGPVKSRGTAPGAAPGKHRHAPIKSNPKPHPKPKPKPKPHRHKPKPHKSKVTTTPATASAGNGNGVGGGSGSAVSTATHASAAAPTPVKQAAQGPKPPASGPAVKKPKPRGVVVDGRLLSGPEPVVLSAARGRTSAASAHQLGESAGSSPVTAILAACAVALLLCLGAASELRYIRSAP